MAVLFIKLLPFMEQSAQEFSLNHIFRLWTINIRNKLKACKHLLLLNLINLLNFHNKFNFVSIERIFRTIQLLGRCSIGHYELRKLFEFLQPKSQFPFGIQIIRCFTNWAKFSTGTVGLNLGLFSNSIQNLENAISTENLQNINSSNNATSSLLLQNENNLVPGYSTSNESIKLRKSSIISINQSVLMNMMKTTGTGALSANAQQQAKYFFDFQHSNSVNYFSNIKTLTFYYKRFYIHSKSRAYEFRVSKNGPDTLLPSIVGSNFVTI